MSQIESITYHNRALDHLELSAPAGYQPSQTLSPPLQFLRTLGVSGMLPDAIKLLQYLDSPGRLECLDLVLMANKATVRWVDVELKNSPIAVRILGSIDSITEPFSVVEIVQGQRPQLAGRRLWRKLKHLRRRFEAGWPWDAIKLFEVLSPTLGEIEAFGEHVSSGIVEALAVLPIWDIRGSGFCCARSQLPNPKCLRLVGVDLEGLMEYVAVPLHRLLRHCIDNRRGVGSKSGVRRLEIYNIRSYDLDDNSLVMVDLQAIRDLVDELYARDFAV